MSKANIVIESLSKPIVEMANLRQHYTGLTNNKLVVYVSTKQGSHGARVKIYEQPKVGKNFPSLSLSISKEPEVVAENGLTLSSKDLAEVKYWISINSVLLLKLWNSESSSVYIDDFLNNFDKI